MSDTPTWPTTAPLPLGTAAPSMPIAALAPVAAEDHDALRPGTRLDEFEILRVLGAGGFGIVYLALDHVLLREVAIKEYMPTALAGRGKGAMVSVRSAALAETFAIGLESFCNEARLLARFDHPSLVKVHRFWKANGSAYMVMPYYPGPTLKEARRALGTPPDAAWLGAFVEPLLGALELLHREGVYHRDIAPDNILLLPDGRPVLLDFGSARRVIGDRTQSLTAVLKPNFAPVEQYADEAGMRQGPWTDLYALGATLHFMLTGQPPTPAVLRAVRDAMPALSAPDAAPFPGVPAPFLAAIDWTLALAPDQRPQSVAALRQAFSGELVPPPPSPRHAAIPRLAAPEADAATEVIDLSVPAQAKRPGAAPRRSAGQAALAGVALMGIGALGFGAWALGSSTAAVTLPAAPSVAAAAVLPSSAPLAAVAPLRAAAPAIKIAAAASSPAAPRRQRLADAPLAGAKAAPDAAPRGPKDACGELGFFALARCVSRECQAPQWRAHPQCIEARSADEQRRQRMEQ